MDDPNPFLPLICVSISVLLVAIAFAITLT
jgi:hypothetical protein